MDNDDAPVGRILGRRQVLALLGSASLGTAFLAACREASPTAPATTDATATAGPLTATAGTQAAVQPAAATPAVVSAAVPSCIVRPELTEGPFFVDEGLNRSDIRIEPADNSVVAGIPLVLTMNVTSIATNACNALSGAIVDVWQCDAVGRYSDVRDQSTDTRGKKFLRGQQVTDANGRVTFTTIYPGWYQGRATHIHFKIRRTSGGKSSEFTSQFFFDEATSDEIYASAPYRKPGNRTRNTADGIFQQSGGKLTLALTKAAGGYASTFDIGLQA
jgi:protocatechuate 3,4-dioxygenase beta subunit